MVECESCVHNSVCELWREAECQDASSFLNGGLSECTYHKSAADAVEVRHGKWHIMPEDPYDESECPTEEGWYRIITTDGEEMTDYYFNKPTLVGRGVVYWRNCKTGIRAWAKMDGKDGAE